MGAQAPPRYPPSSWLTLFARQDSENNVTKEKQMALSQICCIRDRAIDAYGRPIFVTHIGAAIRSFADEINNTQSELSKHPGDYDLYHIGQYEDTTGEITSIRPKQIAIGKEQVKPE